MLVPMQGAAVSQVRARSETQSNTDEPPEATVCRLRMQDLDGEGLRGTQERRDSSKQVAQQGRAGAQAGCWHTGNTSVPFMELSSPVQHPVPWEEGETTMPCATALGTFPHTEAGSRAGKGLQWVWSGTGAR